MMKKLLFQAITILILLMVVLGAGCTQPALENDAPQEEGQGTPSQAEAQTIHWRMAGPWSAGTGDYELQQYFAAKVADLTDGQFEIEVFAGGAIVDSYQEFDACSEGTLDAIFTGVPNLAGTFGPASRLFVGYPGGPTIYEMLAWYYEGGGNELNQEILDNAHYNIHHVGPGSPRSAEGFGWFKEPITSLDDFKGMKFRTAAIWGEILSEELGASVIQVPAGELYEAFMRGVIDAFEFSTPTLDWDYGYQELGAIYHMPGIHQTNTMQQVDVNADEWAALSPQMKAVIETAAEATASRGLWQSNYEDGLAYQKMLDYGVEIYDLPVDVQEGILDAAQVVYDRYRANDPFFDKVMTSQEEFFTIYRECQDRITGWVTK